MKFIEKDSLKTLAGNLLLWKRLVTGFVFLFLIHSWYSGMMLVHVWDSPFVYKGADPSYWLIELLRVPAMICSNATGAWLFSVLLLASFFLSFVFVKRRWPVIVAGSLLLIYQLVFNYKIGYHTHHLFGFQFALFPFYFGEKLFPLALGLSRILTCLAYFFAGFFKVIGGVWKGNSFAHILENQHGAYFYFEPDSWRAVLAGFFVAHPFMAQLMLWAAMLLQLSFAVGLFTNRFNWILALFILMFHLMDWWLMNLGVFMGMCAMMWLLLYQSKSVGKALQ